MAPSIRPIRVTVEVAASTARTRHSGLSGRSARPVTAARASTPVSVVSSFGQRGSLESMGFHKTAGYACGANTEYKCATDYTRPRDYNGPYGHCDSPRFRDQGQVVSGGKRIQFGEPNPEIFSYQWPYWNWGSYVKWCHDNHLGLKGS